MRNSLLSTFATHGIYPREYSDVLFCTVKNGEQGISVAKELIYSIVDRKTLVYLSGGSTPKPLYELLAREEKFSPGAVGLIDERYGEPMHSNSNEKMIADTGLARYLKLLNYPYYPILKGKNIEETTDDYDELVRSLLHVYRKSVAIMGIGADGHTAGIAPNRQDFENNIFNNKYAFVSCFTDEKGSFKQRVTMTFLGLSMLDLFIILAFGADKKLALQRMFDDTYTEQEVPARFFLRPDSSKKTVVITDQTLYNTE